MTVHRFLIPAIAALPFLAARAEAQDTSRLRSWDRNRDGVITRSEWQGTLQEFRSRDGNRDGVLSGDELRGVNDAADEWQQQDAFLALDRNRDGRVARAEWRGTLASFRRADRNGDNVVTRGEFLNVNAGFEGDTDFRALDADRSGRIERDEWTRTRATFNRLDANRDGVLTRGELAVDDVFPAADEFASFDLDNNGVISRSEWRGTYGSFSQYDHDRDGAVTRVEYETGEAGDVVIDQTFRVDSREPWTGTGLFVTPGQTVTYRAEGTIQMSTSGEDRANPAGAFSGRTARNAPRPIRSPAPC